MTAKGKRKRATDQGTKWLSGFPTHSHYDLRSLDQLSYEQLREELP